MSTTGPAAAITLLPASVRPTHYDLVLTPDLEAATFTGEVGIDVRVGAPVGEIVLNAIELEVGPAGYRADGAESAREPSAIDYDEEAETVTLRFDGAPVGPGAGRLTLAFRGS